jgi:hypothetical protein
LRDLRQIYEKNGGRRRERRELLELRRKRGGWVRARKPARLGFIVSSAVPGPA